MRIIEERPVEWEPVFIAGNCGEVELVEQLLADEGIEYIVQPETFTHLITAGASFEGLLFLVLAGQAPYCRGLFTRNRLTKGLVPGE